MIINYVTLVEWIKENVPTEKLCVVRSTDSPPVNTPSADESALWFYANREAEHIHDASHRELAEYIQQGIGPIDSEWIDNDLDYLIDAPDLLDYLIDELKSFFQLNGTTTDDTDEEENDDE